MILVDLALTSPNLAAFSTDPSIPGVADLVRGTASFGQILTRDKLSRVQIIPAGRVGADSAAMLLSERLAIALDALARSYDHVVIDAGAVGDFPAERMARFAPQAVLVAGELPTETVDKACEELASACFSDVWLLAGSPPQPDETAATVAAA